MKDLLIFVSSFVTGDESAIHALRLNLETGEMLPVHRTTVVQQPFFLAISPDRRFLYATHAPHSFGGPEADEVMAFEILGASGKLKPLNRQSAKGSATCFLDVDATGKTLLVANYTSGSVAALPIHADGTLGEAVSFFKHEGRSVDPERQMHPNAHAFLTSPNNQYAFAADLGIDRIVAYRLTPETAKLVPANQPFVRLPPGSGPRHLIFHPTTSRMYVINELLNTITVFDHDVASGYLIERQTISTLPANFSETSYTADLKITPNGRFLYGTNRGHDSIAAYRIGDDGMLSLIEIVSSHGAGPQNLAITPDGTMLLSANMPGNILARFHIDPQSGRLKPVGSHFSVKSPSCIVVCD